MKADFMKQATSVEGNISLQSPARWVGFIQKHQWEILKCFLFIADALLILAALKLAYIIRFESGWQLFQEEAFAPSGYYGTLESILIVGYLIIFYIAGLYQPTNLLGGTREYVLLLNCTTIGLVVFLFISFLIPEFILARGWLLLVWCLVFLLTFSGRFVLRRLVYITRRAGLFLKRTLIVGVNEEGFSLAQQLSDSRYSGLQLMGFVGASQLENEDIFKMVLKLGNLDSLDELIQKLQIEELLLTSSALSRDEILEIFRKYGVSKKLNLRLSSGLFEMITTGMEVREFASVPLMRINRVRLTGVDLLLKTLLDYIGATLFLILVSPILVLIAIAIKVDSKGPIIYRRRVLGVNGKEFDALKFRTMHINGDEILASRPELVEELKKNHKLKDDPRITRVGKWLRKTSLDEFPQFFNVLKNEMSIVGPRMISPEEIHEYSQWGINLLTVKPGITGLWQVSGRSDVSYEERVRMDMYYIRNWTIWMDLQLILHTIPAVISKRGAY